MYSCNDTPKGWVAPFGYPRIKACSRLPVAFRSVPRPSSPPGAKASTECPSHAPVQRAAVSDHDPMIGDQWISDQQTDAVPDRFHLRHDAGSGAFRSFRRTEHFRIVLHTRL